MQLAPRARAAEEPVWEAGLHPAGSNGPTPGTGKSVVCWKGRGSQGVCGDEQGSPGVSRAVGCSV